MGSSGHCWVSARHQRGQQGWGQRWLLGGPRGSLPPLSVSLRPQACRSIGRPLSEARGHLLAPMTRPELGGSHQASSGLGC